MSLSIGIIGIPNVGKSTLFNALTHAHAESSNYPFCTVDKNTGIVEIPDPRLNKIATLIGTKEVTPATIKFIDIAGLVKGASIGEGLGNKFLAHIREVNAIIHVVRFFEDDVVIHVDGNINPLRDIETVNTELMLSDLEVVEGAITKLKKTLRIKNPESEKTLAVLEKIYQNLSSSVPVRDLSLTEEEKMIISGYGLLTSKPVIYAANIHENDLVTPFPVISSLIAMQPSAQIIPLSIKIECELSELSEDDKIIFMNELGLVETGIAKLILASYRMLMLNTFYTLVRDKLTAWKIGEGTTVLKAAGKIHTDMERGFIRAEVASSNDLFSHGSMQELLKHGLLRSEGKDYIVKDGDILRILFKAP